MSFQNFFLCSSRKYPNSPCRRDWNWNVRPKNLKKCVKLNLNYQRGGGGMDICWNYTIVKFDSPSSWSLDASETGESTNCLWVRVVEGWHCTPLHPHRLYPQAFCTLPSFAYIQRPRWRSVKLNDWHLQSLGKIGDCKRYKLRQQVCIDGSNMHLTLA